MNTQWHTNLSTWCTYLILTDLFSYFQSRTFGNANKRSLFKSSSRSVTVLVGSLLSNDLIMYIIGRRIMIFWCWIGGDVSSPSFRKAWLFLVLYRWHGRPTCFTCWMGWLPMLSMGEIFDVCHISATHVSAPKRCYNFYWTFFCICYNCKPFWRWETCRWDATSMKILTLRLWNKLQQITLVYWN